MNIFTRFRNLSRGFSQARRGQGMVEFALVLPVLLLLVLGIVDFGRLMITISSVSSASRDAARYGASVGSDGLGTAHYQDCQGIRETVQRNSLFLDLDLAIEYDPDGPGATDPVEYCSLGMTVDPTIEASLGSQIVVQAEATYSSFVLSGLFKLPSIPIFSEARRTILRDIFIN